MSETPRPVLSLKREAAPRIEERLHKVLAQAGLGSRRALEERIATGQVRVNGEVAITGSSVKGGDRVEIDGRSFVATAQSEPARVLLYHKPEGELTTREDPEGRPTVFDRLPPIKGARWIAVGRLDVNTTGLLMLTTDGDLANVLMHPSSEVTREYVCRIHGEVSDDVVQQLQRGVELEDGTARFDEIERVGNSDSHAWFRVVLREGRNREVRRMWEAVGFQVSRLKRVRYGKVELPRLLRRGHTEEMGAERVAELRQSLGLPDVAPVLTLQSVIGQRRAKGYEHRPSEGGQKAWTGTERADEGTELRRFDNLREDRPSRPGPRGKKPFGKGPRGPRPDNYGNTLTAPAGKPRGRAGGRAGGGVSDNSGGFRSWYVPEGVTTTSPSAQRPRVGGRPFGKPGGAPAGSPYGRSPGAPGGRPGGRPGGAPGGRPGGAPGGRPAGGPGGRPAGGKPGPRGPGGAPRPAGPRPGGGRPRGGGKPGGNR
jgi:23S rRNA pseudouridine2605 synthase